MDFQLQLALNNSTFFENSALILAQRAVAIAERVGLTNLTFDEPTLGDGNCFYRSIVQQLRRPEIRQYVHPGFLHFFYSHKIQQNCLSFESKLCKIYFTEQIINKYDT